MAMINSNGRVDTPPNTDTQPQDITGWYDWDVNAIIDQASKDPDWYKDNAGLIDYVLGEKSYDRRWDKNSLKAQFDQIKALGINAMLAMSLLSGAGQSLSGGADSNSASYLASRENNRATTSTSRANNITNVLKALAILVLGVVLGV